jgi:dienelactone hydrolase
MGSMDLTDVIGHRFINAQLIADQLAANGYLVVMPDLFHVSETVVYLQRMGSMDHRQFVRIDPWLRLHA